MNELLVLRPRGGAFTTLITLAAIAAFANLHCSSGSGGNAMSVDGGTVDSAGRQSYANLAYAAASPAESLDLYLPAPPAGSGLVPLVIWIHGGGFNAGDKSLQTPTQEPTSSLLGAGYAVASLNYRLSQEAKYPAAVQDVKAAVRWLRANAPRYRLDANRFAVWGESAGAYLAVMIGVTGDQATMFDDDALGNAGVSSAVQAVVDWFGQTDFLAIDKQYQTEGFCGDKALKYDPPDSIAAQWFGAPIQTIPAVVGSASPMTYIAAAKSIPPFAIDHGDADCEVPVDQSRELDDALTKAGAHAKLTIVPGAAHADPMFYSTQFRSDIPFLDTTFRVQRE